MSSNYLVRIIIPVLIATGMLISCGGTDSDSIVTSHSTVSTPEINTAMIVYLSGEVTVQGPDGERIPEIGDTVVAGESLATGGDGYVELQFGDLGATRIIENTVYVIDEINFSESGGRVAGSLGLGTVISKVKKLTNKDYFQVRAPGAVCAVRGTEFLVRADEQGTITIAVAEGSVSVIPPVLSDTDPVSGDEAILSAITALMPIVEASEEIVINTGSFMEVEAQLVAWKENESLQDTTDDIETLSVQISDALTDTPSAAPIREENASAIRDASSQMLSVSLVESNSAEESPALVTLTVTTTPVRAQIYLNNGLAGRGSISRIFEDGMSVDIRAISEDGRILERTIIAGSEAVINLEFETVDTDTEVSVENPEPAVEIEAAIDSGAQAEERFAVLEIETVPDDAVITVNDSRLGRGGVRVEGLEGEQLRILVERPGYAPYQKILEMNPADPAMVVAMEPRVEVNRIVMPGPGVGSPAGNGRYAVVAAANGNLIAVDYLGRPVWVKETANRSGENTSPVIIGNRVYVIGEAELVALDLYSGRIHFRRELSGGLEDRFGRRPVESDGSVVIPGDTSLHFFNPENGEELRTLEIPQGSRSTPARWEGRLIIADQRGTLHVLAPDSRSIEGSIPTASQQPIGLAPAISQSGRAVITGRRGTVSAVDLKAGNLVWERPLVAGETVRVYSDAVIAGNVIYIYGGERLFALSMENGRDIFRPIGGVTAPPMIKGNLLVLCRDNGALTLHDRNSGELRGEIPLGESIETRPVALGDFILAAGERTAFVVDPRSISEY